MSSGSAARAIILQLFFSRTRALVSSFSIRIVAQLLSSRPRVYSSPRFHVPDDLSASRDARLVVPHDLRLGEVAEVRKLEKFVQLRTWFRYRDDVTSSVDSPVRRIVGQMLPRCELAPGTHIQPCGVRDLRYATVPCLAAVEEPIAFRRLDVVISCSWWSGLKHRYNVSQSSAIVAKNLKEIHNLYFICQFTYKKEAKAFARYLQFPSVNEMKSKFNNYEEHGCLSDMHVLERAFKPWISLKVNKPWPIAAASTNIWWGSEDPSDIRK